MLKGISGIGTGALMIIPGLSALIFSPIIFSTLKSQGPELLMLIGGIVFGSALFILGIVAGNYATGLALAITASLVMTCVGFGVAASMIAENDLMIKYSRNKEERESNLASIRTAAIYSVMVAAFFCSVMYAFGGFLAAFMTLGAVELVLTGLFYWKLTSLQKKSAALNPPEVLKAEGEVVVVVNAAEPIAEDKALEFSTITLLKNSEFSMPFVSLLAYQIVYFFYLVLLCPMIVYLQTLLPSTAILAYFVAPIVYLLMLPIVNWAREEYGVKVRTMILLGQCIMAFGALIICGDVFWLGRKYMIALTGLGCACFGLSQCVV